MNGCLSEPLLLYLICYQMLYRLCNSLILRLYRLWLCSKLKKPDLFLCIVGGPSGSGKTSLAHKMANIVGCEVVSLESYYRSEQMKDFKYDDFGSIDLQLLSKVWKSHTSNSALSFDLIWFFWQNINDIRHCRKTNVPIFDLETGARSGFKDLVVSEDCGVVCPPN